MVYIRILLCLFCIDVCSSSFIQANASLVKKEVSSKPLLKNKGEMKISPSIKKPLEIINSVSVIIYPTEFGTPTIITKKELTRAGIDGKIKEKDAIITDHMIYSDVVNRYHIPLEQAEKRAEEHLVNLKKYYNVGMNEIENLFKEGGCTYAEGVQQLVMMYMVNDFIDGKIKSRLIVSDSEVKKYCEEHPEFEEGTYKISKGFIAGNYDSSDLVMKALANNDPSIKVEWTPSYWLSENEISESKKFITTMPAESVSEPIKVTGGYELIKLLKKKDRREKSFEERYKEVSYTLRYPQFEKEFATYKNELNKRYTVVHYS